MVSIGFNFTTNDIYCVALEGSISSPKLIYKDKITLPVNHSVEERVDWFESTINSIFSKTNPDSVSYRLTINNVTNNYVQCVYYGQSILNLICYNSQTNISHVSPASISPSKFNLSKGANLYNHIDELIGKNPPYWNKSMRDAALTALIRLTV